MANRTADESAQIQGLTQFRAALRQAGDGLPRQLSKENQRLGQSFFVPEARRRAGGRTNPRPGQRVIDSIGAAAVQAGVVVYGGGKRAPEFYGHEFGSMQRRSTGRPKGHTTQFPARSGSFGRGSAGYFFYPAARATAGKTRDAYEDVLERMTQELAKA